MNKSKPVKVRRKKEPGHRYEFTIDEYTDACLDKIQALGFGSRKDAIKFAIMKVSEGIEKGEIKKP